MMMHQWQKIENSLRANFVFSDFKMAFAFMTEVAFYAEEQGHHPDWRNVYNRIEIALCTHDAANTVTEKDWKLAQTISSIYERYK